MKREYVRCKYCDSRLDMDSGADIRVSENNGDKLAVLDCPACGWKEQEVRIFTSTTPAERLMMSEELKRKIKDKVFLMLDDIKDKHYDGKDFPGFKQRVELSNCLAHAIMDIIPPIPAERWETVEGFKPLTEFPGYYVSWTGQVFSLKGGKIKELSPWVCNHGYMKVDLSVQGSVKKVSVHRLVAMSYLENSENKTEVNHIDGKKRNNYYKNLEWCTSKENAEHAFSTGLCDIKGEKSPNAKLKDVDIPVIFEMSKSGYSNTEIARIYKTSKTTIRRVLNRETYSHIGHGKPSAEGKGEEG